MSTTYGPDFQFETATEPPKAAPRRRQYDTKYSGFMAHAKANPGVWVKYPERSNSGNCSVMKKRGFEAKALNNKDSYCDLWIMWPAEDGGQ